MGPTIPRVAGCVMSWLWIYAALTIGFVAGAALVAILRGNDE